MRERDEEYICKLYPIQTGAEIEELREEIIRCRDCKWFREGASPHDPDGRYDFCTQFGFDFRGSGGFCAWSERRES